WYLYINPDIPYSYNVKGKRSGTAEVVSASLCSGQKENTPVCHIQDRQLSRHLSKPLYAKYFHPRFLTVGVCFIKLDEISKM
ncbi:MAG: hypothetical protein J6E38_04650, partial [Clostridia bacterium]|nr:hypothetical protein [Clostridia bacterium]